MNNELEDLKAKVVTLEQQVQALQSELDEKKNYIKLAQSGLEVSAALLVKMDQAVRNAAERMKMLVGLDEKYKKLGRMLVGWYRGEMETGQIGDEAQRLADLPEDKW